MGYFREYAVTPEMVGDWEGEEELAATQVNRIYEAIDRAVPEHLDSQSAHALFGRVWDDWGYDLRLLDLTDEDIWQYAQNLTRSAA